MASDELIVLGNDNNIDITVLKLINLNKLNKSIHFL